MCRRYYLDKFLHREEKTVIMDKNISQGSHRSGSCEPSRKSVGSVFEVKSFVPMRDSGRRCDRAL